MKDIIEFKEIDGYHHRAKIFGGWLVKAFEEVYHHESDENFGYDLRVSMCFVPDPNHEWEITCKNPCPECKKEWNQATEDCCSHCGNEIPF